MPLSTCIATFNAQFSAVSEIQLRTHTHEQTTVCLRGSAHRGIMIPILHDVQCQNSFSYTFSFLSYQPQFSGADDSDLAAAAAEEEEEEDDQYGAAADTYAHYMPSKCQSLLAVCTTALLTGVLCSEVWMQTS